MVSISLRPILRIVAAYVMTSLVAQTVKNPSAMWETWVQFLGLEGPPEGMASRSTILVWRICMDREKPGRLQSMGLQKVGHD